MMKASRVLFMFFLLQGVVLRAQESCVIDTAKCRKAIKAQLEYLADIPAGKYPNRDVSNSLYTVSIMYAMLGLEDSAYYYFPKVGKSFGNLTDVFYDSYFKQKKWAILRDSIMARYLREEQEVTNVPLLMMVDTLISRKRSVQYYNAMIDVKRNGKCPLIMRKLDKLNRQIRFFLKGLANRQTYPSKTELGLNGLERLYYLIQFDDEGDNISLHMDLLHKMKEALKEAEKEEARLLGPEVAYLTDRLLVWEHMPQRYGTQIQTIDSNNVKVLFPIEDPVNIHNRRKAMNLKPLGDYLESIQVFKNE